MTWDDVSPTLTTGFNSITKGRFGHPTEPRPITLREAARLHGFEDSFEFKGTLIQIARQIGNSVAPPVAKELGKTLIASRTIALNTNTGIIRARGKSIKLGKLELSILQILFDNKRYLVPFDRLAELCIGNSQTSISIRNCITRLRKKLGDDEYGPPFIISHRGKGYELNCI